MRAGSSWSSGTSGSDGNGRLANFQESIPIQLIATRRADFKTCSPDEDLSTVIMRNRADSFDFLPVVDKGAAVDGPVLGVLDVAAYADNEASERAVGDVMQNLGERHLIGADASILTFIYDADQHPFRLVVAGREISGLVTLSDLQQLPVRAALFAMVTHLEMMMADAIRSRYADPDVWMRLLPPARYELLLRKLKWAENQDTLVDPLLYTQFCDKVTIIAKSWRRPQNDALSKAQFQEEMKHAQDLRNHLAHANDYADTRDKGRRVCKTVQNLESWANVMAEWRTRQT